MLTYGYWFLNTYYPEIDLDKLKRINEHFNTLNESEQQEEISEGLIGKIVGSLGGAWLGPKIGKVICKVLGIESGLLYNFLTSGPVGAALGYEVAKNMGGGKGK